MKIRSLESEFGWIKVNGEKFEKDIIIHSNGAITKRKKKLSKDLKEIYGHTPLSERELDFLENEHFSNLYVGVGHEKALPITPKALEILENHRAIIDSTYDVIKKIEKEESKFVAIIHITC